MERANKLRLLDDGKLASRPGDIIFSGGVFMFRDHLGMYDPRTGAGAVVTPSRISMVIDLVDAGGSRDMDVDGSGSPVVFSMVASTAIEVHSLRCILADHGDFDIDRFGGIDDGIAGVALAWNIGGQQYEISTIKDNADMMAIFGCSLDDDEGPLVGSLTFDPPVSLGVGDSLTAIVSDDLKKLDLMRLSAVYSVAKP